MEDFLVVWEDGGIVKEEKINALSIIDAVSLTMQRYLIKDVIMVVQNSGLGAYAVAESEQYLDCGSIEINGIDTTGIVHDNDPLPMAWARVSNISGETRGIFEAGPGGECPDVELKTEKMIPLFASFRSEERGERCPRCGFWRLMDK